MGATVVGSILITEQKLDRLLASPVGVYVEDMRYAAPLSEEIERACVISPEATPDDLVTMNSTVRVHDLDTDQEHVYTITYPHQANAALGRISVLAPIGTPLLGYRAGDIVEWQVPSRLKRLQIVEVITQPERAARPRPARENTSASPDGLSG